MKKLILGLSCLLLLTSCVTREQADTKLAKGCEAAAGLFLDDSFSIKEVKRKTYNQDPEFGNGYRKVMLFAVETDGWLDLDKEYVCIFAEEFGVFNSSHNATIYQLKVNDQTYGIENGNVLGDIQKHMKIMNAVEDAMH